MVFWTSMNWQILMTTGHMTLPKAVWTTIYSAIFRVSSKKGIAHSSISSYWAVREKPLLVGQLPSVSGKAAKPILFT